MRRPSIVVATAETSVADGGERLLELVAWMRRRGLDVEILALGEGWDLDRFRAVGPTVVVDEFRRRGPARPADLLGLERVAAGVKSIRLRRWLRRRRHAAFLVFHPAAAAVLRYAPGAAIRFVAALPTDGMRIEDLRSADAETLTGATGWVVATPEQADAVTAHFGAPVRVLGNVVDPTAFPPVRAPDPGRGVIALVAPSDPWSVTDHAIEIAHLAHRAEPAMRFRWLVPDRRAAWLARHDVDHANLGTVVDVVELASPDALTGLGAIVRSSTAATADPELVAAVLAGVPILDFAAHPSPAAEVMPTLGVEHAVQRLVEFAADPGMAAAAAATAGERLPLESFEQMASGVLRMLEGR